MPTLEDYQNVCSDFELLDLIRVRYQMYAANLDQLIGILVGYHLVKHDYQDNISEFRKYLSTLKSYNANAVSWMSVIKAEAKIEDYEIPIFFGYLDVYRKLKHQLQCEFELSFEHRRFDFDRRSRIINIDYPELPLKAPHKLKAMKLPDGNIYAFYYDENGLKYYEQCLQDIEHFKKWANTCFNIDENIWQVNK